MDDDLPYASVDARIARLYREAALEEPRARLDNRLAALAREPAPSLGQTRRTPWWISWRVPFAFAVMAVVSFSLIALMQDGGHLTLERRDTPQVPSATLSQAPPELNVGEIKPAPSPLKQAPQMSRSPAEAPSVRAPSDGRPAATVNAGPEHPAAARLQEHPTEREIGTPAVPPLIQRSAPLDAAAEPAQDTSAGPGAAQSKPEPRSRADERSRAVTVRDPGTAPERKAKSVVTPPSPAPLSAQSPSPYAPTLALQVRELEGLGAPAWIDRILALRREGKSGEAAALLAELRRRYPTEPLPAELRE